MDNLKKKMDNEMQHFLLISVNKSNVLTDDAILKIVLDKLFLFNLSHFEWQVCFYVSLHICYIFISVHLFLFQCPPGMKQQVLAFYTKLLGRIQQPLLPHINVHRPVQVLFNFLSELCFCMTSFSYSAAANGIFNFSIFESV